MTLSMIVFAIAGLATGTVSSLSAAQSFGLEIGLRIMNGDAQVGKATTGVGESVGGSVWTDLAGCAAGGGDREPGGDRVRWRISGRIVQRTGDAFVVEAEWQRIGDGTGRSFDGQKSTQQFTIRQGERAALDEVALQGRPCAATSAKLEAAIVPSDPWRVTTAGGRGVSGGGGSGARSGVSGGLGAGSGIANVSPGATAGSGAGRVGAGGRGAGGGGSGSSQMAAAELARSMGRETSGVISGVGSATGVAGVGRPVEVRPVTNASYDVEAWLVHTPPAGNQEAQRVSLQVSANGETFSFTPVFAPTPLGIANVDVAVMLRPVETLDGQRLLHVVVTRRVSGSADTLGGSAKFIPMPRLGEVVSFEMPPAGRPGQDPTPGHQFSVRVRLAPGKAG